MANKHICCLKPRRCSVCKIQMRYSNDTLCVRSLVQPSSGKYLLLPHWTGKLICMGGEPCCGRCVVLCRVKEEQQTHFMNYWKNRPRKEKSCLALVVGSLDLWVTQNSAFQQGVDTGELLISISDTPSPWVWHALTSFLGLSLSLKAGTHCIMSVADNPSCHLGDICKTTHYVSSLRFL